MIQRVRVVHWKLGNLQRQVSIPDRLKFNTNVQLQITISSGSRILVRRAQQSFDPREGALSPMFAQNSGFPLELNENCMILKIILGGKRAQGPLDPMQDSSLLGQVQSPPPNSSPFSQLIPGVVAGFELCVSVCIVERKKTFCVSVPVVTGFELPGLRLHENVK